MASFKDDDSNVYAPPLANLGAAALPRPASTLWVMAVLLGEILIYAHDLSGLFVKFDSEGVQAALLVLYFSGVWIGLMIYLPIIMCGLVSLLLGKRSRFTYAAGIVALLSLIYSNTVKFWQAKEMEPWDFEAEEAEAIDYAANLELFSVCVLALSYLSYRFIFGFPSRQYYGLAR